jgi:hypothetical protein
VDRLLDLEAAGCAYVVLGPTTDDFEQLLLLLLVIKPAQSEGLLHQA